MESGRSTKEVLLGGRFVAVDQMSKKTIHGRGLYGGGGEWRCPAISLWRKRLGRLVKPK